MRRPLLRVLGGLAGAALALLGAGFLWFVQDASRLRPIPADADGIVVLTGGALRVETGLALLEAGVAPRLLISGVGDGVTTDAVIASAGVPVASAEPNAAATTGTTAIVGGTRRPVLDLEAPLRRIMLGRGARTTVGNAVETASWARRSKLRSIVVVTAGYHMRRAVTEIGALLPGVALRPCAVHPQAPLRLLAIEYLKFLAVELGTSPIPRRNANT